MNFSYHSLATIHAVLGNKEEALKWLEKNWESQNFYTYDYRYLTQEPMFESIKDDERFISIINEHKNHAMQERRKFLEMGIRGVL